MPAGETVLGTVGSALILQMRLFAAPLLYQVPGASSAAVSPRPYT